jgi:hypothetical protein
MRKGEVECPSCGAWYRRIEIASMKGEPSEYACLLCGRPLERFSGETYVAYGLTVQPLGRSIIPSRVIAKMVMMRPIGEKMPPFQRPLLN